MPGELEQLFGAARRDAMNTNMTDPANLRAVAERRTRTKWMLAAGGAAAVIVLGVGVAAAVSRPVAAPPAGPPSTSPSAGVPRVEPSITASPSAVPSISTAQSNEPRGTRGC